MSHHISHQRKLLSHRAGFTLLETVVAIGILMLGVLGPMELSRQSLKASRDANDRLVASFLAQEGIEMVRAVIANTSADLDQNATPGPSGDHLWLENLANNGDACSPNRCIVDVGVSLNSAFAQCSPANGPNACSNNALIYQDSTGIMRQPNPGAGWSPTKFSRSISVTRLEDRKRIIASTTVWWPRGNVTLQEDVYNWFFQLN